MKNSNYYTTSINIDEIQYIKDMYNLRDYVLFFAKEEKEKEIYIFLMEKTYHMIAKWMTNIMKRKVLVQKQHH